MLIELENVSKGYLENNNRKICALADVSLKINQGEFIGLVGPSGSGKSTLLNIIGCLEFFDTGRLSIEGKTIECVYKADIARFRNLNVGFIFQKFNLISSLTVFENIELPLLISGAFDADERAARVDGLIERVGLGEQRNQSANLLSGGQMQRVAVARALVMRPKFVLADEPTANLDRENAARVLQLLRELNQEFDTTFVFATHDQFVMDRLDYAVKLQDGRILH